MRNQSIPSTARRSRGFTLVEMLVAMGLGLFLLVVMTAVYLSSKTAFKRQDQLNAIQQSVRIAFEYLSNDARMVDHRGCFTGRASGYTQQASMAATSLATNFALGVEGYEYNLTSSAYTLTGESPSDVSTGWATNAVGITAIPVGSGQALGTGLTPGSDVLVLRLPAGKPVRLTAAVTAAATSLSIDNISAGSCSNGTASNSGFCNGSYGLIASCTAARAFQVATATAGSLALGTGNAPGVAFATSGTEVIPLQTVAYYIKKSSSGTTTSLYRRVFDGSDPAGTEQELIEGVETLQLSYGVDTTTPTADGAVDSYVTANNVTDWSRVVSVRMSLLVKAPEPVSGDLALPASAPVNKATITYPTGSRFERRVFTTTVAIRNRIPYS